MDIILSPYLNLDKIIKEYESLNIVNIDSIIKFIKIKWLNNSGGIYITKEISETLLQRVCTENNIKNTFNTTGNMEADYDIFTSLNHWKFIPIYYNINNDNNPLLSYFPSLVDFIKNIPDITMVGFMILQPFMTVPWHNHTGYNTQIIHINLYNLKNPSYFYVCDQDPYIYDNLEIKTVTLQYKKDNIIFKSNKYHKTYNPNEEPRISFVVERKI